MSDENGNDQFLDIPAKFADWKNYKASSGHKVNHAKTPNAAYTECEHPIFGKILCLYVKEVFFFLKKKLMTYAICKIVTLELIYILGFEKRHGTFYAI